MPPWFLRLPTPTAPAQAASFSNAMAVVFSGVAQVVFIDNPLSGVFNLIAVVWSSWRSACWLFIGLVLGMYFARELEMPDTDISLGLYSFNAALTALALSLRYLNAMVTPVIGILLSV